MKAINLFHLKYNNNMTACPDMLAICDISAGHNV
jgi:hypothetical protein